MNNTNQLDWVAFYKDLASKLLKFNRKRDEFVAKVLKIYETNGLNIPTLEKDNKLVDIDPLTVFGLFNKSSLNLSKILGELFMLIDDDKLSAVLNFSCFIPMKKLCSEQCVYYWCDEHC